METTPVRNRIRQPIDLIGFAHRADQMDEIMRRISQIQPWTPTAHTDVRLAISPHDDYSYVGNLYPEVLSGVTAPLVVLFGVAHRARQLGVDGTIVLDDHDAWSGPYGVVEVEEGLNRALAEALPPEMVRIDGEMHGTEHSIEAILPFLQHFRRERSILPILVPAMQFDRMKQIASETASVLSAVIRQRRLVWGRDVAMVISNDAVHYGDEGWGGRDFAEFGTDITGYQRAVEKDLRIIDECLTGELGEDHIARFQTETVRAGDYREYRWSWCGRYSVPFGLLTADFLQKALRSHPLAGKFVGYVTSIDGRRHIPVEDLGLGITAPATLRHWVGYAGVVY